MVFFSGGIVGDDLVCSRSAVTGVAAAAAVAIAHVCVNADADIAAYNWMSLRFMCIVTDAIVVAK